MLITKEVYVKGNSKFINYYRNLGYIVTVGELFLVKIEDLKLGSNINVLVSCDMCNIEKEISYKLYNTCTNNQSDYYFCKKCCNIKTKRTNLIRYGVEVPIQNSDIKAKIFETNLNKYGNICSLRNELVSLKSKETMNDRYGVDTSFESNEIQNKAKKTLIKNYGVDRPLKSKNIKLQLAKTLTDKYGNEISNVFQLNDVKEKIKNTNLLKYGKEFYSQTDEMKSKSKLTSNEKYSADNYFISKEYIKLHMEKISKRFESDGFDFIDYDFKSKKYKLFLKDCQHEFEINLDLYQHRKMYNRRICTVCNKIGTSNMSEPHNRIVDFLNQSNIDNIKVNVKFDNKYELDIYLPDYNIGIEFNGIYWHSEEKKGKQYHYNKLIFFKEKNIKLFQIWEDDWIFKEIIIKSMILNKLNKVKNKIHARKCSIKPPVVI